MLTFDVNNVLATFPSFIPSSSSFKVHKSLVLRQGSLAILILKNKDSKEKTGNCLLIFKENLAQL